METKKRMIVNRKESMPLPLYRGMLPLGVIGPSIVLPGRTFIKRSWKAEKIRIIAQAVGDPKKIGPQTLATVEKNPSFSKRFQS